MIPLPVPRQGSILVANFITDNVAGRRWSFATGARRPGKAARWRVTFITSTCCGKSYFGIVSKGDLEPEGAFANLLVLDHLFGAAGR